MLTDSQMQTLVAAIRASADPTVTAALAIRDDVTLTTWCNAPSPTDAWRASMQPQDVDEATPWTAFDALSAGKRDSWRQMLVYPRDFSRNAIRRWVTDVWGNATAGSNAEVILGAAREKATNAQAALGGTVRSTGTVSALDRAFVGQVGLTELSVAQNRF